jgi:hypothetical protein
MTVQAFRCLTCSTILLDKDEMERHIETEHPEEQTWGKEE